MLGIVFCSFSKKLYSDMPNSDVHYYTAICQHTDLQFNMNILKLVDFVDVKTIFVKLEISQSKTLEGKF